MGDDQGWDKRKSCAIIFVEIKNEFIDKNNIIKPSYYNSFYGEIKNLEFDIKNL